MRNQFFFREKAVVPNGSGGVNRETTIENEKL